MGIRRIRLWLATSLIAFTGLSCNSLFYYPSRKVYYAPAERNIPHEEIRIKVNATEDICLWTFPVENPKGTIVQFHGNAENMSSHYLNVLWLRDAGYELVTFDYRGYGCSQGEVSRENAREDGVRLLQYLMGKNGTRDIPIWLYGQSIGGIILQESFLKLPAAERRNFAGLILESTFSSYQKIARLKLASSWLTWPFQWLAWILVTDSGAPDDDNSQLASHPLLIVHSPNDPVVPFELGEEIYGNVRSKSNDRIKFLRIEGGGHIDSFHIKAGKYRPDLLQSIE